MTVLIADDNSEVRRMLKTLLRHVAEVIVECEDGVTAVAQYAATQPDWVLMDVQMPGMNGITATQQITAAFPAARIVIVTDFDDEGVREAAFKAGARNYVRKENLLELRHWLQTEMAQPTTNASNLPATEKGTIQ